MPFPWDITTVGSTVTSGSFVLHAWEGPETWQWSVMDGLKLLSRGEAPSHSTARWAAEESLARYLERRR
jgi:hypothetical protein